MKCPSCKNGELKFVSVTEVRCNKCSYVNKPKMGENFFTFRKD